MSRASRERNRQRQVAAQSVVDRARDGDQVAMGILAMVRDNAKSGNETARQSLRAIDRYIRQHKPTADMGFEKGSDITNPSPVQTLWASHDCETTIQALPLVGFWPGVVALSHGPQLDNDRVNELSEKVDEPRRLDFKGGVMFCRKLKPPTPDIHPRAWTLGRVVGVARLLQRVQAASAPISLYCPVAGWEHGE